MYHRHKSLAKWILTFGHQPLISCLIAQETVAFVLGFLTAIYISDSITAIHSDSPDILDFPFEVGPEDMKGILSVKRPSDDVHRKSRTSVITVSHGSK